MGKEDGNWEKEGDGDASIQYRSTGSQLASSVSTKCSPFKDTLYLDGFVAYCCALNTGMQLIYIQFFSVLLLINSPYLLSPFDCSYFTRHLHFQNIYIKNIAC